MRPRNVIQRHGRFVLWMQRAERIEPRMQFKSAPVRLFDRKGERVIKRLRRPPHRAGEIFRPRLDGRGIHRVGRRTHLKNNCVQLQLHRAIQQRSQLGLLFRHAEAGFGRPVLVRDGHEPRAAKFARRWRRCHGHGAINLARREQHRWQQPDDNGQKSNSNHKLLGNKTLWRTHWQRFFWANRFLLNLLVWLEFVAYHLFVRYSYDSSRMVRKRILGAGCHFFVVSRHGIVCSCRFPR